MAILLAQLGDIHFRHATDPALSRAAAIGAAIAAEISTETPQVVLALCGDAAFAGLKEQFGVALRFFKSLEAAILDRCPYVTITRVIIPGNHDCSFDGDQAARNALLGAVTESKTPPPSITDIILAPLADYFDFATEFAGNSHGITNSHRFHQAVNVKDGDATLRIHLLNTAWMSALHEQPGSLHFPLNEIISPSERADLSLAILHHPINWFSQPHVMRPLRDRVGTIASVVLVNHEHVAEALEQTILTDRGAGGTTLYVSGGVIQEDGCSKLCTFNILTINVAAKLLRVTRFELDDNNGSVYFKQTADEEISVSANALSMGPAGASLTREMVALLDDPGAPITHPHRDPRIPIRLFDIFLYPDLWELDADHDGRNQKQIKSANVPEEVLAGERTLITGGEKSGRSSIVKSLFRAAFDAGKVPLLLSGNDIRGKKDRLRKIVRHAVKEQYSNLAPDQFEQLQRSERVVLIDDVQQMGVTRIRRDVLGELERQFGAVVLCGEDLIKMEELSIAD